MNQHRTTRVRSSHGGYPYNMLNRWKATEMDEIESLEQGFLSLEIGSYKYSSIRLLEFDSFRCRYV